MTKNLKKKTFLNQNMKFLNFFLILWVIIAALDPDTDSEYGSGSTDLIESESNLDPNPKPWLPRPFYLITCKTRNTDLGNLVLYPALVGHLLLRPPAPECRVADQK